MILTGLSKYRDFGLLFLRACIGAMIVMAGWPKLTGGMQKWEMIGHAMANFGIHFLPVFWGFCCALTETLGGALVILGLWFRPATMFLTINFVVATMMLYTKDSIFPSWALPAVMLVLFFSFIFIGPGRYSVDRS